MVVLDNVLETALQLTIAQVGCYCQTVSFVITNNDALQERLIFVAG